MQRPARPHPRGFVRLPSGRYGQFCPFHQSDRCNALPQAIPGCRPMHRRRLRWPFLVTQQNKGEFLLLFEFPMRLYRIKADTQDDNSSFLQSMVPVAKATGLFRASGRAVFWIKIEDNPLPAEFRLGCETCRNRPLPENQAQRRQTFTAIAYLLFVKDYLSFLQAPGSFLNFSAQHSQQK